MLSFRITHKPTTGSTNDDVLASAESGEAEGLVITAATQTGGRGRRGRSWFSPPGNLYASLLLRPDGTIDAGLYNFVASLAIAAALRRYLDPARVRLKWPNDVLVDGAKISGIILESAGTALVVGFGVNIAAHPDPAETRYPATSLAALGFDPARMTPAVVLDTILEEFSRYHGMLHAEGFSILHDAWMAQATGIGENMVVKMPDRDIAGRFMTIDEQGRLLLEQPGGMVLTIAAGDVFFMRSGEN
ncbi:MAG: biotin--[acetyl-CoA-carboxylase] ligase [Alphaproteobacteria bacterium]